jgi:hypothetical protein
MDRGKMPRLSGALLMGDILTKEEELHRIGSWLSRIEENQDAIGAVLGNNLARIAYSLERLVSATPAASCSNCGCTLGNKVCPVCKTVLSK